MMDQRVLYTHVPPQHVPVHAGMDLTAFGIIGATLAGWLPTIAAGLSVVYLCIQIALGIRAWRRGRD